MTTLFYTIIYALILCATFIILAYRLGKHEGRMQLMDELEHEQKQRGEFHHRTNRRTRIF